MSPAAPPPEDEPVPTPLPEAPRAAAGEPPADSAPPAPATIAEHDPPTLFGGLR